MSTIKRENFNTRSKKLGLNGVIGSNQKLQSFLYEKRIIITGNNNGHNYGEVGNIIEVSQMPILSGGSGNTWSAVQSLVPGGNSISFSCFSVIEEYTAEVLEEDLQRLKESKKEIDKNILEIKYKLAFMKDHKLEVFDEDEFKVFQTLQVINKKDLSELDKAKAIAKLIKK